MEEIKRSDIAEKDLFKNIIDSAIQAETVLNSLNKEIGDSVKSFSKLSKEQIKLANFKELQEAETEIKKVNLAYRESLKIQQEEEKLKQTRLRTQRQEETARAKELRQAEQANSLYAQQSKRLNDLRKAYKDMALAGQEGTKSAREMKREIDKLDTSLKKADASVGQFQRNVGNYPKTFSQIGSAFGMIAGVLGTGLSFDALKGVADGFRDIKIQAQQLGYEGENIERLAVGSKALAETFKDDQVNVMRSANTIVKEFGVSIDEAMKMLENGYLSGANAQGDLTEQVKEYSTQIKASGGDANTLMAIISKSNQAGIFSDKGVDAVKEFGLRIREQTTATSDAMNNAFGKEFTDKIFKGINDGSMTSIEALELISKKMNDATIPTNKLQTVIADVFGGAGEDAGIGFLKTLTDINSATENLVNSNDPLVQQQQKQLELNQQLATAQNEFAKSVGGTGMNIDNLILKAKVLFFQYLIPASGWILKLTAGFVAFKTVQAVVNTDFKALLQNFTNLKKGAEDGASSMSKFGNALKGIGWSVAIGFAIDYAMKLYDVASGAESARLQHEALQKAITAHNKEAEKLLTTQQKSRDTALKALNDEAKRTKMSETEYKKRLKLIEDEYKAKIKGNIRFTNDLRDSAQKEAQFIAKMLRINADTTGKYTVEQYKEAGKVIKDLGGQAEAYSKIDALKLSIGASNAELVVYNAELKALNPQNAVMTDFTGKATTANNANAKSVKEQTKNYDEFLKRITGISALLRVETDELNKLIEVKRLELDLDRITETDEAINRRRSNIARIKVLQAEAKGNEAEIRKARINEIKEELAIELENIELSETDKQRLILESEAKIKAIQLESLKQTEEAKRKAIDMTTKYFTERIDQQIAKEDEKIKKSQELADILEQQAVNGNIDAEKSLATQKKLQDEAEKNKIKLEQRKRAIELGSAFLQSFNSELASGKNVQQALLSAGATTATLDAFIQTLASFDVGSDEIKVSGGGVDGKGGMMAVIHDGEKIFTKDENKAMGGKSRAEIVDIVRNHDMSRGAEFSSIVKTDTPILNIKPLIEAVKDLQNDIKNRPVSESNIGAITSKMMQIIDTKRTPTTTTNNRFNIRP